MYTVVCQAPMTVSKEILEDLRSEINVVDIGFIQYNIQRQCQVQTDDELRTNSSTRSKKRGSCLSPAIINSVVYQRLHKIPTDQ